MDNDTLSDYWKDVSPILKEQNAKNREQNYDKRIDYAIKQFENNNIPFKLCNKENGHFNLYKDKKVVMSFWSWTGKCYIPSINFSENIGLKNCIKKYKKMFMIDKVIIKKNIELLNENKRLKNALEQKSYCKYANECNSLLDCSKEEYNDMAQINMKMSVELFELKEVIDKISKIIYEIYNLKETTGGYPSHYVDDLLDILKEVSK